jgi:hypothetical protein
MKIKQIFDLYKNDRSNLPRKSYDLTIVIVAIIVVIAFILGLAGEIILTADQMYLIRPLLTTCIVFIIFSYILKRQTQSNIFGEIGFIYLALASAYTVLPIIALIQLNYNLPLSTVISPQPEDLSTHCWRHVLFVFFVAVGYLAIRGRTVPQMPLKEANSRNGKVILILIVIMGCCIFAMSILSSPVNSYIEHYTRFDHLSWTLLRVVYVCLIFKTGTYFVLFSLMFCQYNRYRNYIYFIMPILCVYEIVYSYGSRIQTLIILLAFAVLYHYKANPINIRKGIAYLAILAVLFSAIEIIRASDYNLTTARQRVTQVGGKQASEFASVFNTSFHLYTERAQGTLPPRDWQMFFYEFISLIPFIDHTTYHPQYWYARNYFPQAVVPPQTMGVLADSAIWGGELDLIIRSLINGAVFALLTRWFLRRRQKWWALTIYIYCYATCIMTLKYSVLYQLTPLVRILLPTILFVGFLFLMQKAFSSIKLGHSESVA